MPMTRQSVMYLCMRSASASSGMGVAMEGDWGVPGMVGVASSSGTDMEVEVELFAVAVVAVKLVASMGS